MSEIKGTCEYFETALEDGLLMKAMEKLSRQIHTVTEDGHCLVKPMRNAQDARFMVLGDYDLSRRWSWRIYNGPIPSGHRIYVTCGEQHCVEPTHLSAYKAERPAPLRLNRLSRFKESV